MLKFSNRFAILGLILIDKANYIKERMGIMEECIFLMAGFKCLELQHGIWTSDVSGDEKSAVWIVASKYCQLSKQLIKDNEVVADHIYNADEMGLLWRCLRTSAWAGEVET
jgi:hypothetical protein